MTLVQVVAGILVTGVENVCVPLPEAVMVSVAWAVQAVAQEMGRVRL